MPYYPPPQLDQLSLHFIIGPHRSGTTLLTSILNAHPQLLSTPEFRFVLHFMAKYGQQTAVTPDFAIAFNRYIHQIFGQEKAQNIWSFMQFSPDIYGQLDGQKLAAYNFCQLYKLLLINVMLPSKNYAQIQTIVDKNPHYTFYIPQLLDLFPSARFLVAMRDYRAIYLSKRDSRRTKASTLFHAVRINEFLRCAYTAHQHPNTPTHLVPYEHLAAQPSQTIQGICHFLDLPFNEGMLSPQERLQNLTAATDKLAGRDQKIITELVKPINTSRIDAWKTKLTDEELTIIEAICGEMGQLFGYQPSPHISSAAKQQVWKDHKWTIIKEQQLFRWTVSKYYTTLPYWLRQRLKPQA